MCPTIDFHEACETMWKMHAKWLAETVLMNVLSV